VRSPSLAGAAAKAFDRRSFSLFTLGSTMILILSLQLMNALNVVRAIHAG